MVSASSAPEGIALRASAGSADSADDLTISGDANWCIHPPARDGARFANFVVEAGATLTVPGGTVIRCAGEFTNSGVIRAGKGGVQVHAGQIENRGAIHTTIVKLKAEGEECNSLAIHNSGTIRTMGGDGSGGRISLVGGCRGKVTNSGALCAARMIGGDVDISGLEVLVKQGSVIDASASSQKNLNRTSLELLS